MVEHPVRHLSYLGDTGVKRRRPKQEQQTQQKRDIKISEYGSIIITEEHNITSANPFPGDDEKEEFGVVIIQGNGNLLICLASIDAILSLFDCVLSITTVSPRVGYY